MQKASQEAATHKAALFIGEFGHDPKTALGQEWLRGALAQFDEVQASWAVWLYEEHSQGSWGLYESGANHTRGKLRNMFAKIVARPFPPRLAGRLAKMSWDAANRTLTVSLNQPMALKHEFSIPSLTFPTGAAVRCDGQQAAMVKPLSGRAIFSCRGSSISISPP